MAQEVPACKSLPQDQAAAIHSFTMPRCPRKVWDCQTGAHSALRICQMLCTLYLTSQMTE